MLHALALTERFLRGVWGFHYRIPELAYWAGSGLGLSLVLFGAQVAAGSALVAVAAVGIGRWKWDRWNSRGGLVVARFSASPTQVGRDVEAQRVILASLRDKLPPLLARRVHGISVVVGSDDRDLAIRLRRRLRADFLLHGRIGDAAGGGWSVYARVTQPAATSVLHFDWHTRDITPARVRWQPLFDRLTPSVEVMDDEYPFEFASELEAIVKGSAGQLALTFRDFPRAEHLLRDAIAVSPASKSHQIDNLRAALARSLGGQDRIEEALAVLRERSGDGDASPELLRTVHRIIFGLPHGDIDDHLRAEAIDALRKAADQQNDPQRAMTLYNLLMEVFRPGENEEEAARILAELIEASGYYRRAWYVKRFRGLLAWLECERLRAAGDDLEARAAAREAAKWYSRAIRARPKFKLLSLEPPRVIFGRTYPRSPILHANAMDAHQFAGNRLRTCFHRRMAVKLRWRRYLRGMAALESSRWDEAYAYLDWSVVGWDDDTERVARVLRCIALRQRGDEAAADADWEELPADPRLVAFAERSPGPTICREDFPAEDFCHLGWGSGLAAQHLSLRYRRLRGCRARAGDGAGVALPGLP